MKEDALDYSSPVPFTAKQRLLLATAPPLAVGLLRCIGAANRVIERGREHFDAVVRDHGHVLLGFWHEALILAAHHHRGTGHHTLTSYSFDGEMAARLVYWNGMRALRGSSSRGGYKALKDMAKAIQQVECVGLTLDGPRGPRRVAKPGIAVLSGRSGVPVLPFALVATKTWRMRSWDRLMIPKPFGTLVAVYGEPIAPPPSLRSPDVERIRLEIERRVNQLQESIESEFGGEAA